MRRWMWWLMPPWGAKIRRRQALIMLHEWQEEERAAARTRIAGLASILDEPTALHHSVLPLFTRGQSARAEHPDPK